MNKDEEYIFEMFERFYRDDKKRQRKMVWFLLVVILLIIVMFAVYGYYLWLNPHYWF